MLCGVFLVGCGLCGLCRSLVLILLIGMVMFCGGGCVWLSVLVMW